MTITETIINEANNYDVYFRAHNQAGISLPEMQSYQSFHGWYDDEEIWLDGLACSDRLGDRNLGGALGAAEEVVVLRGQRLGEIYDGVVIYPTAVIHRFTVDEYLDFCHSL